MFFQNKAKTEDWLMEQLGSSSDIICRNIKSANQKATIIYINSLCDEVNLHKEVLKPFYEASPQEFTNYIKSLPNAKTVKQKEDILTAILQGGAAISLNGEMLIVEFEKVVNNNVGEATVETVIQGPQNALTEDITTNLNQIRHRYPQASLRIKSKKIGRQSQTKTMILYDEKLASPDLIEGIEKSLANVDIAVLSAAGQLHKQLTTQKRTLFPTMMITERPDRIAYNLAEGKAVIVIDGTPFVLITPSVFYDFMSSMEDVYQSFWISRFIVLLRYMGLAISLLLPAFYIGVTAYNPEFFRVQLALGIAGSRAGVPYPAFLEVLFMLLMMELLTEASVRLPKSIGSTATTVGGLILGQAAVEAGLVSNVMIIIVAAVAISNFVIPINAMSFAMRVAKYILLILTIFFGMVGLVMGVIGLVAYLANLSSSGQPYLKLFFIRSKDSK
ncbi:spore germination protein [Aquibacillus kalidii]|uniref:spore germination protein n=1 Tax=Aquibacillus kalidii TaxID=2762597 RepID=UPI00164829E0|nr:spore germination protein [Aquibacillus kalidii]